MCLWDNRLRWEVLPHTRCFISSINWANLNSPMTRHTGSTCMLSRRDHCLWDNCFRKHSTKWRSTSRFHPERRGVKFHTRWPPPGNLPHAWWYGFDTRKFQWDDDGIISLVEFKAQWWCAECEKLLFLLDRCWNNNHIGSTHNQNSVYFLRNVLRIVRH